MLNVKPLNTFVFTVVKHMFDGCPETCWNSDQGASQYILLDFLEPNTSFAMLRFTFQGGFVGQDAVVEVGESLDTLTTVTTLHHIKDNNDTQEFPLCPSDATAEYVSAKGRYLKVTFSSSTDFYGRVTIYSFEVFGSRGGSS